MTSRWLRIAIALLLVALVGVLLRQRREPAPHLPLPAATPTGAEREPELESAPAAAARRSGVESAPGAAAAPPAHPASAPEVGARIDGRLRVLDEHDRSHEDLDGTFVLTAEDEHEGRTIAVRGGRFGAELRAGIEYRVEDVRAGGRPAVPTEYAQPRRNAAGDWEVTARWARDTVLTVVSADTGVELAGIDLLEDAGRDGGCQPAELERADWLARDARSPITLPLRDDETVEAGTRILHARAPGYAWGCVRVPASLGGAFRLALERGGSLEVRVEAQDASAAEAFLRLRRAGDEDGDPRVSERLDERATLVVDGLEAGTWVATLELGHRWRWPQVLARAEAAVTADRHASVTLRVPPVDEPVLVRMSGRVRAGRAWGFRELALTAELLDAPPRGSARRFLNARVAAPRAEAEEPAVWEWELDGVQPGRWSVDLPLLGLGRAVDVPLLGLADVELVVPDPVDVSVELRERGSGLAVPDGRLAWTPPRGWSDVGGQLFDAEAAGAGRFHLRAPAGELELWCFSDRHRFVREVLALAPPRIEHVVQLDPACGFVLRLRCATTPLPWPFSFRYGLAARRLDGEGRADLTAQDGDELEARFTANAPGLYLLELPGIPGYAPLPPQRIRVPAEGFVLHDVELEPR
jgi:hypothetical protein